MGKRMPALAGRAVITSLALMLASVCGQATVASAQPAAAAAEELTPEQYNGYWRIEKPVFALMTSAGKLPPLTAEGKKVYNKHLADRKAGNTSFDPASWCASLGYPRALLVNYPFQIIVRPQHVVFLHEWNWWHEIVYLPGSISDEDVSVGPAGVDMNVPGAVKIRPEEIPGSMGFSQGAWQGSKLIVNTDLIVDTTILDSAGLPHSDDLKMTTTWQLLGPDRLQATFHFEDSEYYSKPWDAVATFARQAKGWEQEDVCLDRIKNGAPAVKEAL